MKKIWIVLVLLLALACIFAACDTEEMPNTGNNGNTEQGGSQNGNNDQESAHTHTWGEWITITPATCVDKGAKMHICACGASEAAEIPTTSVHTYDTSNKCTRCQTTLVYTEGLEYILNADESSYTVKVGSATEVADIVIPPYHNSKPVTVIGEAAFGCCASLTSIIIPASVTDIDENSFNGSTALSAITVDGANTAYTSIDGVLYDKAVTILINYPAGKSDTSFVIPDSVTTLGECSFLFCTLLTSIKIPTSVTYIGHMAFAFCTDLANIAIPASVTHIADEAFGGCTGLTSILIPASVTNIGTGVFYGCTGLESITVANGNTVYHSAGNCLIETMSKTLIAGFKNSVIPVDGSVTSISFSAFAGCTDLESITIPASVTHITHGTFGACTDLTSVIFAETSGWVATDFFCESNKVSVSASDLSNHATAAEYLTSTYNNYYWNRTVE